MAPPSEPRLHLSRLTKSYSGVEVLTGVDLDVAAGENVLLAGGNGSGKTTLLRCVAALTRYEGEISLDGQPVGRSARSRIHLGYLPQAPGLAPWATPRELIALFARLRGSTRPVVDVPDDFLPPLDRRMQHLSGGQRQRVAIALTLLGSPRLLLLDEPAANLDEDGRDGLDAILAAARARGISAVVAAPSPDGLGGRADRMVWLKDGRVHVTGRDTAARRRDATVVPLVASPGSSRHGAPPAELVPEVQP